MLSFLVLSGTMLMAQNKEGSLDDVGRIAIAPYVPTVGSMTPAASRALENKLAQGVAKAGMSGFSLDQRFVITSSVDVITKDVIAGPPPKIAYTLDINVYIADTETKNVYGQDVFSVKGVGTNETKAYISSVKRFNPRSESFQDLVQDAKTKIIEYYNSQCDFILEEGQSLASQGKYEEAIAKLMTVPEVCKECYSRVLKAVEPIYKEKVDDECQLALQNAKNAWNGSQSFEGAMASVEFLKAVNPQAEECFQEVQAFSMLVNEKVKELRDRDIEIEDREWNFTVQVHNDQIELVRYETDAEREVALAEIEAERATNEAKVEAYEESSERLAALERERINAYREVSLVASKNNAKAAKKSDEPDVSFIPGLENTGN